MNSPPPHFDVEQDLKNASPRLTPSWTPSGSHIVFGAVQYSSDVAGYPIPEGRIYIAESNGSSLLSITEGGGEYVIDHSPSVSPDGSRIAYSTYRYRRDTEPRYFEIETAALDGSGRRRLTEKAGLDIAAAWSPEGDRIAFLRVNACDKAQSLGIYTVESDGSDVRRIMELPDRELGEQHVRAMRLRSGLAWSPDGQALAFLVEERMAEPDESTSMRTSLYVVKTNGSDRTRLLVGSKRVWTVQRRGYESDDFISSPAWSPDGRQIAFLKLDDRRYPKLYIIDSDGSNLREVVDPGARSASLPTTSYSGVVSWSSDGSQILFYLSLFDPRSADENPFGEEQLGW